MTTPLSNSLPKAQTNELIALFKAANYTKVESRANALLKQYPNCGFVWKALGAALQAQGKNALPALQRTIQLLPDDADAHNILGNALQQLGKLEDAAESFRAALAIRPDFVNAEHSLGNVLSSLGQLNSAANCFRHILAIKPDSGSAHIILGDILQDLDQLEESASHFQRGLEIEPQVAGPHNNFGNVLRRLRQPENAIKSYRNALAINPSYSDAHCNLGVALGDIGKFDESLQHISHAISLLWTQFCVQASAVPKRPFERYKPIPPMIVSNACETLDVLRSSLDTAGIPWCLYAGSLLGIIRDGNLLPYDKDMDIALPAFVDHQQIIHALTGKGDFRRIPKAGIPGESKDVYSMSFMHVAHSTTVDLFFLHPDDKDHYVAGIDKAGQAILAKFRRFDFALHPWRGTLWPVPASPEKYLEDTYGPTWSQADRGFDRTISNHGLLAVSMPPVLCYGYNKIYATLLVHHWQRCRSYCRQLLARRPDPLLVELDQWLAQQESPP